MLLVSFVIFKNSFEKNSISIFSLLYCENIFYCFILMCNVTNKTSSICKDNSFIKIRWGPTPLYQNGHVVFHYLKKINNLSAKLFWGSSKFTLIEVWIGLILQQFC